MPTITQNLDNNSDIPLLTMNDGRQIPQLGFGTFQLSGETCYNAVRAAITAGYRHIDTAAVYGNEEEVGRAIQDAIDAGEVTRDQLFVTTKLWNDSHDRVAGALDASLERLGLDYVDLYLIHWLVEKIGMFATAYRDMVTLREQGKTASVGVCNSYPEVLDKMIEASGDTPAVNQIEVHPGFNQDELRAENAKRGILTESWSPLKQGQNLDNPAFQAIADAHGVTVAQVIIRWHIQRGDVVIPRSSKPERIRSNADVFGFQLTEDQMQRITAIEEGEAGRRGPNPHTFYEGTSLQKQ
ncbi:aldo/keto reductase [Corynebacterium sp. HMSC22B11]|uniref:aldo/keto reductase n=1 Tax=Corynebacterium sp. HMSC22B11 TaxID=1581056 RepID=UPI0008A5AB1B|nr:aldo/keto reductase [Corynebacterium sp. HMSC22B11]OFO15607.1 aldo/keto reductase [Corynebacterium sp. HMSC22B11]